MSNQMTSPKIPTASPFIDGFSHFTSYEVTIVPETINWFISPLSVLISTINHKIQPLF